MSATAPAEKASSAAAEAMRRLALGVTFLVPLLVWPGLANPFSQPKWMFLGVVVCAGMLILRRHVWVSFRYLPRAFSWALGAWLAALGAAAAFGEFVSSTALLLSLCGAGWFLILFAAQPESKRVALALALSSACVSLLAILQFAGVDPFVLAGWVPLTRGSSRMRVFATLGNPNFVSAFLVSLLPLTLALRRLFVRQGWLFWLLLTVESVAILATGSRAAVLGLGGIVLWFALLGGLAEWKKVGALTIIMAVLLLTFAASRSLGATLRGRLYIWRVAAPQAIERPIFGFGPGGFAALFPEWETQWWRSEARAAADRAFVGPQDHAHNDYLEILLEQGAAGLLSFLGVLCAPLWIAVRHIRRAANRLVAGAAGGVVALAGIALVDFPFMRPTEMFVYWTLLAIVFLELRTPSGVRYSGGEISAAN